MKAIATWTWSRRVWVLAAALAGVFVIAGVPHASAFRNVKEGDKPPAFKLKTVSGETIEYSAPPEVPIVLAFIRQGHDKSEGILKDLAKLKPDVGEKTVVLGVVINPTEGDPAAWVAKIGVTESDRLHVMIDGDGAIYGQYGVVVAPQTATITPEGVLKHEFSGYTSSFKGDVEASLREILGIAPLEEASAAVPENLPAERKKAMREMEKAQMLIKRKMKSKAIPQVKIAVESDDTYLEGHILLGELLLDEGGDANLAEAEKQFKRGAELDPANAHVKVGLARLKAAKGDYDGAVADIEAAAKINPRSDKLYFYLGILHEKAGKFDKAAAAYKTAYEKLQRED